MTGLALALGAALSIAYYGLSDGMNAELVHALTRYDLGDLQVHVRGWTRRRELEETLPDATRILDAVRRDPSVVAASPRVYAAALVSSGSRSTGVELVGVDPSTEPKVTELDRRIVSGRFLSKDPTPWPEPRELTSAERALDERITEDAARAAEDEIDALAPMGNGEAGASNRRLEKPPDRGEPEPAHPSSTALSKRLSEALSPRPERPPGVAIGSGLAHLLSVRVGDPLFLSTQAVSGIAEGVRVRVLGIFETGTSTYDRARVYLHVRDLQRLVHLGDRVHEIAAITESPDVAPEAAHRIARFFQGLPIDVRAWSELRPDMVRMLDLNRVGSGLLAAIVFFMASLGVVNTMLMSVLERTRELGVLKAIGMSGARVFAMIVGETTLLAVGGALGGTVLGLCLDFYLVRHGVDLSSLTQGVSFGGVGMEPVLHGAITPLGVLEPVVILTVVCLGAAVYPAYRAARMQPAVGMRET